MVSSANNVSGNSFLQLFINAATVNDNNSTNTSVTAVATKNFNEVAASTKTSIGNQITSSFNGAVQVIQSTYKATVGRIPNLTNASYYFYMGFFERLGIKQGDCYIPAQNTSVDEACGRSVLSCVSHSFIGDFSCCNHVFTECGITSLKGSLHLLFKSHPFLNLNTSLLPKAKSSNASGLNGPQKLTRAGYAYFLPWVAFKIMPSFHGKELLKTSIPFGAFTGMASSLIWGQNLTESISSAVKGAFTQLLIDGAINSPRYIYDFIPQAKAIVKKYHQGIPFFLTAGICYYRDASAVSTWAPLVTSLTYMIGYKTVNPWAEYAVNQLNPFATVITTVLALGVTSYFSLLPEKHLSLENLSKISGYNLTNSTGLLNSMSDSFSTLMQHDEAHRALGQ